MVTQNNFWMIAYSTGLIGEHMGWSLDQFHLIQFLNNKYCISDFSDCVDKFYVMNDFDTTGLLQNL